jgi:drug/metabolite transporter (DMT)-like permease
LKHKGFLFATISAISYGLIPLFIVPVKNAGFSLDKTLFYRFFIAFLFVLAYLLYQKVNLKLSKFEALMMVILGLLYALSSDCLFLAYDYLSAGIASTILFVYPIIVAIIMALFYQEKLNLATKLSLLITFVGVIILSAKESLFDINFI